MDAETALRALAMRPEELEDIIRRDVARRLRIFAEVIETGGSPSWESIERDLLTIEVLQAEWERQNAEELQEMSGGDDAKEATSTVAAAPEHGSRGGGR